MKRVLLVLCCLLCISGGIGLSFLLLDDKSTNCESQNDEGNSTDEGNVCEENIEKTQLLLFENEVTDFVTNQFKIGTYDSIEKISEISNEELLKTYFVSQNILSASGADVKEFFLKNINIEIEHQNIEFPLYFTDEDSCNYYYYYTADNDMYNYNNECIDPKTNERYKEEVYEVNEKTGKVESMYVPYKSEEWPNYTPEKLMAITDEYIPNIYVYDSYIEDNYYVLDTVKVYNTIKETQQSPYEILNAGIYSGYAIVDGEYTPNKIVTGLDVLEEENDITERLRMMQIDIPENVREIQKNGNIEDIFSMSQMSTIDELIQFYFKDYEIDIEKNLKNNTGNFISYKYKFIKNDNGFVLEKIEVVQPN